MCRSSPDTIDVLHVDDGPAFADLAATFLEREDDRFRVETVTTTSEALDALAASTFDCVVSDYDMPRMNGIELLETVRESHPDLPFILFTGKGSEAVASDAISAGVTDYLQKESGSERYKLLANRIENAVSQQHAERRADETDRRLRELTEATNDVLWMFTHDWSELLYINSAYEEIWGRSTAALAENPLDFLDGVHPEDREAVEAGMVEVSDGVPVEGEYRVNADRGYDRWVWVQAEPIVDEAGEVVRVAGFARDVTERKEREQNRELMEHLVNEMNDGAVIVQDGVIEFSNPRITDIVGYSAAELAGMPMGEFIAPEDRELVRERHHARVTGEGAEPPGMYEIAVVAKDGNRIPVEINVSRIEYDGRPATVSLVRDITDRQERRRELGDAQRRFDAVFNNPISFMALLDPDGTVIDVNETALSFVECSRADVVGDPFPATPWWDHSAVLQDDLRGWIERAADGDVVRFEADHYAPDGTRATADGVLHPIRDDDGAVVSLLAAGRDISERRQHERELEARTRRLDRFASIVSHDLRNPLNVAEGHLELARETGSGDHFDAVARAHERMDALIEDLLTLARTGESPTDAEPVDPGRFAERCWANVDTGAASLVIKTERSVRADESRLQQLFENLLRNSVEHGSTGDQTRSDDAVTVTVGDLPDAPGFYVEDDGRGIPEADRERVLEAGYSTRTDGTGFGLSIVAEVADAHDWDLRVTESAAGGARFEFAGVETA